MFQQLVPLLRQRSVLLTVTSLEDDQIRVNVMPKKLKEGENSALTTPMSFTGTPTDAQMVADHLPSLMPRLFRAAGKRSRAASDFTTKPCAPIFIASRDSSGQS